MIAFNFKLKIFKMARSSKKVLKSSQELQDKFKLTLIMPNVHLKQTDPISIIDSYEKKLCSMCNPMADIVTLKGVYEKGGGGQSMTSTVQMPV